MPVAFVIPIPVSHTSVRLTISRVLHIDVPISHGVATLQLTIAAQNDSQND